MDCGTFITRPIMVAALFSILLLLSTTTTVHASTNVAPPFAKTSAFDELTTTDDYKTTSSDEDAKHRSKPSSTDEVPHLVVNMTDGGGVVYPAATRGLAARKSSVKVVKKSSPKPVTKLTKDKLPLDVQSGGERPMRFAVQPKDCTVTPGFSSERPMTEFTVECPPAVADLTVVLDFTRDPKGILAEDALADLCDADTGSPVSSMEFILPPMSYAHQRLVVCDADTVTAVTYNVVVRTRPAAHLPQLSYLGVSRTADGSLDLDVTRQAHNVTLYANEPVVIAATVDVGAFVASDAAVAAGHPTSGHVLMDYKPIAQPGESCSVSMFVSNPDHAAVGNYTLNVNTVRSINPNLATVAVSPGRLEPMFGPTTYTYFARVPAGTSSVSVDFTAVNDRDTVCKLNDGQEQSGKGSAVVYTGTNFLKQNVDIVTIDCVAADPSYAVRYILTIVQQTGGSTLLKSLDVVGAEMTPQFNSLWAGPYNIDLGFQKVNNLKWVAFEVHPANDRAIVKVDGRVVNLRHNLTPYYRVVLGERRGFRITIRTPENPVEEEYLVNINRPAAGPQAWMYGSRFGNWLGWASSAVAASSGALSFVTNAKLLQYVSLTYWLNGNPETYDAFSAEMNKFNLLYKYSPQSLYVSGYPTGVDTIADVAFNSSMSDQAYNEFLKNYEMTTGAHTNEQFLERIARKVAEYMQLSTIDKSSKELGTKDEDGLLMDNGWVDAYKSDVGVRAAMKRVVSKQLKEAVQTAHADDVASWSLFNKQVSSVPADKVIIARRLGELLDNPERMLLPVTNDQRDFLLQRLDVEQKQHAKLTMYTAAIIATTTVIAGLAVLYASVWVAYLRSSTNVLALRQDYPRWLHPIRFWTFVFDFSLISYAQACVGLMLFSTTDATVYFLGLALSPKSLVWAVILGFVCIPLATLVTGIAILSKMRSSITWSRTLNRYHDRMCFEGSARQQYFKWLPAIFNQFFTYEVVGALPLCRPVDQEGASEIHFSEDRAYGGPWFTSDPRAAVSASRPQQHESHVANRGYESLVSQEQLGTLQYDRPKDRVRVQLLELDPDAGVWESYEIRNDKAVARHPDATVAYESFRVKNAYDTALEVEVEVQLKHLPKIVQTTENYTMWMPYENLRLHHTNSWEQLIGKAQRGNFFIWIVDRLATAIVVCAMNLWFDPAGTNQKFAFIGMSAALALYYLPSAVMTGGSKWYRMMQHEVYRLEKEERKVKSRSVAMNTWPFENRTAREQLDRHMKKTDQLWCGCKGFYDKALVAPIAYIAESPVFKTRAWTTTKELCGGPAAAEVMKSMVVAQLIFGSRAMAVFPEHYAATTAMCFCVAMVISQNTDELQFFVKDSWRVMKLIGLSMHRDLQQFIAICSDMPHLGARIRHYFQELHRSVFKGQSNLCLTYPGRSSDVHTRELECSEVSIVQNELGLHFPGKVRRDLTAAESLLTSTVESSMRMGVHKTLYVVGKLGATRRDLDISLPMQLSFRQYYCRRQDLADFQVSRLAATIQIVNHSALRFPNSKVLRRDDSDDSYLSLYADQTLLPPQGDIILRKRHGYTVHYNPELHQLSIKGPGVVRGATYSASTTGARAARQHIVQRRESLDSSIRDDLASQSTVSLAKSDRVDNGHARVFCSDAGRLTIIVPPRMTPNILTPVTVTKPNGKKFVVNPMRTAVTYSSVDRELHLSSDQLLPTNEPYTVEWVVDAQRVAVKGRGVAHSNGSVVIQVEGRGVPDLNRVITLRDERDFILTVDPTQTDAYVCTIPRRTMVGGTGITHNMRSSSLAAMRALVNGKEQAPVHVPQTVPCTIVQCIDPVNGVMRVEPNFDAVLRSQQAWLEELEAKCMDLDNPHSVGRLIASGILPLDKIQSTCMQAGLDCDYGGRVLNPFRDLYADQFRAKGLQDVEPRLRAELERQLRKMITNTREEMRTTREWAKAYADPALSSAQLKKEISESRGDTSELLHRIQELHSLKQAYEAVVPGFVYPMSVESCLVSRKPNYAGQFRLWRDQVERWLLDEEIPATVDISSDDAARSSIAYTTDNVMKALRNTVYRAEHLDLGLHRSVLHYVTDSLTVRGPDTRWRPDPLCTANARVRVFRSFEDGRADFANPVWMPCLLKLTANSVKILMPAHRDPDRHFEKSLNAPWRHISGYYVPLRCFEKVDVSHDPISNLEKDTLDMTGCVDGKIVFRKNQKMFIDDRYIRRIEDDQFDNELHVAINAEASDNFETYTFMIGHCLNRDHSRQWPLSEVDPSITSYNDTINIHPLTFRLGKSMIAKWRDAISSAQMDKAPLHVDEKFSGVVRVASVSSESIIEPPPVVESSSDESVTEESSYEVVQEERVVTSSESEEEVVVEPARYDGDFVNNRYHGVGKLQDKDGNVVYEGEWASGLRWGSGACYFTDHSNRKWKYVGNFEQDEMCGPGKLTLVDDREITRLKASASPDDNWAMVDFQGNFRDNLRRKRQGSAPPAVIAPNIADALLKKVIMEHEDVHSIGSSSSSENKRKVLLVIDPRKALSADGDLDILGQSMAVIGDHYHGSRPNRRRRRSAVSSRSSSSSSEAMRAIVEEYLPHRSRWVRRVDPNMGYGSLASRFTHGQVTFANGATYDGSLQAGRPHGHGYLCCAATGFKYSGGWQHGKPDGRGVMEWKDKAGKCKYVGQFHAGARQGLGAMAVDEGKTYLEGTWSKDVLVAGQNVVVHFAEAKTTPFQRYVGELSESTLSGQGKVTFADGASYSGGLEKGQRSGKGTMTTKEGVPVYVGTWKTDEPHGRAMRMVQPDGRIYTGDCVKGKRHGMGELYESAKGKCMYEGYWATGLPSGRGSAYVDDGVFDGDFKAGKRQGKGVFTYTEHPTPTGKQRRYEGDWKKDQPDGTGMYLNEDGLQITVKVVGGVMTADSVKAYKKGMCGSAPKQSKAPLTIKPSAFADFKPVNWGPERNLDSKKIAQTIMSSCGGSPFQQYNEAPFKYEAVDGSRAVDLPPRRGLRRPDSITSKPSARPAEVVTVTLHEVKGLKVTAHNSFIRVKMADRSKDTATVKAVGDGVQFDNSKLKFFFNRKNSKQQIIKFQMWGRSKSNSQSSIIGTGQVNLDALLKSKQVSTSRDVELHHKRDAIGSLRITIGVGAVDLKTDKSLSSGSVSSSYSSETSVRNAPSTVASAGHNPVGRHFKVEVHSAKDLFEVAKIMEPFCRVKVGKTEKDTKRSRRGGRNPLWDETLAFTFSSERSVTFDVFHNAGTEAPVFVGSAKVELSSEQKVLSDEVRLYRTNEKNERVVAGSLAVTVQEGRGS